MGGEEPRELPQGVMDAIKPLMNPSEGIIYFALSDVDEEGRFGERWLVITAEEQLVGHGYSDCSVASINKL